MSAIDNIIALPAAARYIGLVGWFIAEARGLMRVKWQFGKSKLAWLYKRETASILFVLAAMLAGVFVPIMRAQAASDTIFSSAATPAVASASDNKGVELGVKFLSDVSGTITGVRFYKGGTGNGGTHVGHLWTSGGAQLASAQFTSETNSGWQDVQFANPVSISANTVYVASYYAPQGRYSYTTQGFASGVNNAPLHALANSTSPNGVYMYTSASGGAFPSNSFNATNYWVDVDFTPSGTTPPPPPPPPSGTYTNIWASSATPAHTDSFDSNAASLGVKFQSSTAGYINGIRFYKGGTGNGGTHVGELWSASGSLLAQATFTNESASGWQDVQLNGSVPISANTTYVASYFAPQGHYSYDAGTDPGGLTNAASNPPLTAFSSGASGGNGVYAYGTSPEWPTQSYNASNYWVDVDFTTTYTAPASAAQPAPRTGIRGSGPVLVVTDPTNPFTDDYCNAVLKTEGLPECAATDAANLTSSFSLSGYRTIVMADGAPLTGSQISQITTWVQNGGTFVAMRPNDNLDSLLGIGPRAQSSLFDAYFQVNPAAFPGIETQTMQYHGAADEHTLAGAQSLATLFSTSTASAGLPAVTSNAVGSGKAIAYMFDVAKSVVYTRDGNPGLANQVTVSTSDGLPRISDRFALGWLDTSKVAIPQADELQRMLANTIESATLPRLWYFPAYQNNMVKAALIMTGDDHASNSQTLSRFAAETAASPNGCSVTNWTCYTSTSYAFPGAFSDANAKPYTDKGFEVSPHFADGTQCAANWTTTAQLSAIFNTSMQAWRTSYPTISAAYSPLTQRVHCYGIWHDYASVSTAEAVLGIKADQSSACWPNSFLNTGDCLFTGSGIPESYADQNGNLTGVYQFTTQATDENPPTVAQSAMNSLVTNATGANAYYGYFTVLCHLDNLAISNQCASDGLTVAQNNNIPMVSARQAEQFLDGRNNTAISNLAYGASSVSFTVNTPVNNVQEMTPLTYGAQSLASLTVNGTSASYLTQTVNGITYAVVTVPSGTSNVVASYN